MNAERVMGQTMYALQEMVKNRVAEVLLEELVASNKLKRQDTVQAIMKVQAALGDLFDGAITDTQKSLAAIERD